MTLRTSHAGIIALAAQISAALLSPVCGHTVDPATLDVSMGFTIMITAVDWIKRHYSGTSPQNDPLAIQ